MQHRHKVVSLTMCALLSSSITWRRH